MTDKMIARVARCDDVTRKMYASLEREVKRARELECEALALAVQAQREGWGDATEFGRKAYVASLHRRGCELALAGYQNRI